jgi:hypothetical protein
MDFPFVARRERAAPEGIAFFNNFLGSRRESLSGAGCGKVVYKPGTP